MAAGAAGDDEVYTAAPRIIGSALRTIRANLAVWTSRAGYPYTESRSSATAVMSAIDRASAELGRLRTAMLADMRVSDAEEMVRVSQRLATSRGER